MGNHCTSLCEHAKLKSFPSLDFKPSFRHLMPKLATWPDEQVQAQELKLTALELEVFAEQPGGRGALRHGVHN